jgi:opacity protein-like surface antigen
VGAAWNEASDYTNIPKLEEAVASPNFSDHTTFAFSYTLGVGMQYEMNKHWQLGMGYEFSDWGRSHLGAAPGQSLGQGLGLSHFYTHALVLNFTYIQND